jgi:hypothetical protein
MALIHIGIYARTKAVIVIYRAVKTPSISKVKTTAIATHIAMTSHLLKSERFILSLS